MASFFSIASRLEVVILASFPYRQIARGRLRDYFKITFNLFHISSCDEKSLETFN